MITQIRRMALAVTIFVVLISIRSVADAQHTRPRYAEDDPRTHRHRPTGIVTDRISTKSLQRWNKIKQFVFLKDTEGEPLHPILRSLWDRLDKSGHTIYLELPDKNRVMSSLAGSFRIERLDPSGQRHVGVIKLNLHNIDLAYVGPEAMRANGFIPFERLNKEERYVEVLGHELAHAVYILEDLALATKVDHLIEQTNALLLANYGQYQTTILKPEMHQRLLERDLLLADLETNAEAVEVQVWKELVQSKDREIREPR
ncbi:MAG TPA: hypothetical protein VJ302_13620 [Blastocatellia bacterium]|nr:hypothetical protein [Blastocatellia bacterium]